MSFAPVPFEPQSLSRRVAAALGREVEQRREASGLRRGAIRVGEAGFARFERNQVLAAVPWGQGFGAWGMSLRTRDPRRGEWRRARVWLDVEGLNLGLIAGADGVPRRDTLRCWRQARLPFPEDPHAVAWNERVVALSSALSSIPGWALEQVGRMRPYQQWSMLRLLNRAGEPAAELCHSNLALAHVVATRCRPDATVPLLARRQRDILETLGLPSSRSAVRVLRRVVDQEIDKPLLDNLFRWLGDERAGRTLAHAPRIGPALRLLPDPGRLSWLAPSALQDVLGTVDPQSLQLLAECARIVNRLDRLGFEPPGRLQSLSGLESWRERLGDRHRKAARTGSNMNLPKPPIEGVPGVIEPIRSGLALLEEGEQMSHCVFDYYEDALSGRLAFYRILAPERATLALERGSGRRGWRVWSFKRRANREPSFEGYSDVMRWLRRRTKRPRRHRVDARQLELCAEAPEWRPRTGD